MLRARLAKGESGSLLTAARKPEFSTALTQWEIESDCLSTCDKRQSTCDKDNLLLIMIGGGLEAE